MIMAQIPTATNVANSIKGTHMNQYVDFVGITVVGSIVGCCVGVLEFAADEQGVVGDGFGEISDEEVGVGDGLGEEDGDSWTL